MKLRGVVAALCALSTPALCAETLDTGDGLSLSADLAATLSDVRVDGQLVSHGAGGMSLTDPRTGRPPEEGQFTLTAQAEVQGGRVIIRGTVTAAGEEETVCQLQVRIPVGQESWLFWDDMTRSRPIAAGQSYVQSVYPLCCVTDPEQRLGVAVGLSPEPMQPAALSYDPASHCMIINWFFGFTPLARPELRMKAPFEFEIYRVQPGWAFRSALDRYYHFHPAQFDWRARFEGLWLFASPSESLPNPQHYAYNEGGPPPTPDIPRGIATFPYSCTGDLIVSLPVEWGVAKTYEEMTERLQRWKALPRLNGWDELSAYVLDNSVAHTGTWSLRLQSLETPQLLEVRQVIPLDQKAVDPLTVSVWTKAEAVTGPQSSNYGLWLDLLMADGKYQFGRVVPAGVGSHDWQELKITVGQDQPIATANVYLLFRNEHTGTAWFDDLRVTLASDPDTNLARNPGFEDTGPPPQAIFLEDNAVYDERDRPRWFADTWGGADVAPASPINWLRFILLVNPEQRNPEGRQTASDRDFAMYDRYFADHPALAGAYLDGTSGACSTTFDYRREHFYCFRDPFQYLGTVYRPCASGKASMIRWVQAFKARYPGKLAFGNVWASNAMFPMCMALDVCGYESSKWYDLQYADYYRAAAYHKPGLLLNYFRLGQQLDTREDGERFFRYATAYGLFPSIGRFTDEAYEKFGDLQHLYIPIIKHLFRAGWEPVTWAQADDPAVRVQRFGTRLPMYFTLLNPSPHPRGVSLTVDTHALGLDGAAVAALEAVHAASLATQLRDGSLSLQVPLGPDDVAVVALLHQQRVGAWYRQRAAESLQGAAYVYARTPPTAEAGELAQQLRALGDEAPPDEAARVIGRVRSAVERLAQDSQALPDDLKRRSYRRELAVARGLLDEALLADAHVQIGWEEGLVAPVDGEAVVRPRMSGHARLTSLQAWPGRLVEPPDGVGSLAVPDNGLISCPPERAVTVAAEYAFTDANGNARHVRRVGHAFFGPVCELQVEAQPGIPTLTAHLKNTDSRARRLSLEVLPPEGLTPERAKVELLLEPGARTDTAIPIVIREGLPSGTYAVQVLARSEIGSILEEAEVSVVHVLPLEDGNLAVPAAGAHVAVDSSFYAYTEKPLNDGVVLPVGVPFNEAAWASGESPQEHWVEVQFPAPQRAQRVQIYWNIENGVVWTSRHFLVQVKPEKDWITVAEARRDSPEPVTTCAFTPVETRALRILQPVGDGPQTRPHLMWLREVAVY